MSTKDTKAVELGQPLACVTFISNNPPSTPDQHTVHLLINRFCWVLSSILSPPHDKKVHTVWFSICQSFILVTSNKKSKKHTNNKDQAIIEKLTTSQTRCDCEPNQEGKKQ